MQIGFVLTTWVHVLAASAWLGSIFFLAFVLVPTLRSATPADRADLLLRTGLRLRTVAWSAFVVLFLTGFLQLSGRGVRHADLATADFWQGPFGRALAVKLVLFVITLVLSAWHDFSVGPRAARAPLGSPEAARLRNMASLAGRTVFVLGLAIVLLAVSLSRGGLPG
jgi:uncharacterized membrane protein